MTREKKKEIAISYFLLKKTEIEKSIPKNDIWERANRIESEFYKMAIKALEQESILDKAIAEIDRVGCVCHASDNYDELIRKNTVLKILNKYKSESEDKE